jgi:hypothetical protein
MRKGEAALLVLQKTDMEGITVTRAEPEAGASKRRVGAEDITKEKNMLFIFAVITLCVIFSLDSRQTLVTRLPKGVFQ